MRLIKLSLWLVVITTTSISASRHGEKIHFQDSSELGEFDIDERLGQHRRNRNHRGRAVGHQKHSSLTQFESGIPGIYPIRGPAQAPLQLQPVIVEAWHGQRLQQMSAPLQEPHYASPYYAPYDTSMLPTAPKRNSQTLQHQPNADNSFLAKPSTSPILPTTSIKNIPLVFPGDTNQLSPTIKPVITATSTINPRKYDLLYGSNLLEEDAKRSGKAEGRTEISFGQRGLFDTAPHCQPGHILVNNKCRLAV